MTDREYYIESFKRMLKSKNPHTLLDMLSDAVDEYASEHYADHKQDLPELLALRKWAYDIQLLAERDRYKI